MAVIFSSHGKIEKAKICYKKAIEKFEFDGKPYSPSVVKELKRYANLLRKFGFADEAIDVDLRINNTSQKTYNLNKSAH